MAKNSSWKRAAKIVNAQREARMAQHRAETAAAVSAGACPCCGRPVRRNSSLAGWYQCEQYGAPAFRKDANAPACDWQGFTS